MDSNAKELGHVGAAELKDPLRLSQGQNVIIDSCVGNDTANRKLARGRDAVPVAPDI